VFRGSLLKDVTDAPSLEQAREALREAVQELSDRYPDVARMLDEEGEEMLGVYALPAGHRKRMRSTNMLERWFEEVRRRTRVVRIFPNRASCVRLIGAHCMEANEESVIAWQEQAADSFSACSSLRCPTLAAR